MDRRAAWRQPLGDARRLVLGIPYLEESLRIDSSEHFLGLRLSFYIACG